jgi:transcriptional regulator with XRE-family HTH domain
MFNELIKQARKEKGLTQSELATFFGKGYTKRYVSDAENNRLKMSFEKAKSVLNQIGYDLEVNLIEKPLANLEKVS